MKRDQFNRGGNVLNFLTTGERSMINERDRITNAVADLLDEADAERPGRARRRRDHDREDDVLTATAALKAVTGLCVSGDRPGGYHLDHVKGDQLVALLDLITERLERASA